MQQPDVAAERYEVLKTASRKGFRIFRGCRSFLLLACSTVSTDELTARENFSWLLQIYGWFRYSKSRLWFEGYSCLCMMEVAFGRHGLSPRWGPI